MNFDQNLIVPLFGVFGFFLVAIVYQWVRKQDDGSASVKKVGEQIHFGTVVFMKHEYKVLVMFVLVLLVLLYFFLGAASAVCFLVGAVSSAAVGHIAVKCATTANVRTVLAADKAGSAHAFTVAFFGGSVAGLALAAGGLLGLGVLYYFFWAEHSEALHGFAMGASVVALLRRVGGGVFAKGADVGAGFVGKLEAGIPDDDPRNPAVIVDHVGDNVGGVAGMCSDIFTSYCGSIIASIAIASTLSQTSLDLLGGNRGELMFLPLALASLGFVCSLLGVILVKFSPKKHPKLALRIGAIGSVGFFAGLSYFLISFLEVSNIIWAATLMGSLCAVAICLITECYTAGKPAASIAELGKAGPAAVVIKGLSLGMQSVLAPILMICVTIYVSNLYAGLYGVGIAAVAMLATVGMTMTMSAYGPIADNAAGIAKMTGLGNDTRCIADALDGLGNTAAAIGKAFAVCAALLAALAIITAYVETVAANKTEFILQLNSAEVLIGLFIGGAIPFVAASLTMTGVVDTACKVAKEVVRQFKNIKGLSDGKAEPNIEKCVDVAFASAYIKSIFAAIIAITAPLLVGFGIGPEALGGMLGGALIGCAPFAFMMIHAGGAWDNAKKHAEKDGFGGQGDDVYAATTLGDTVGDPLKDASGPSMNVLINVMAIVSLVIAPLL